MNGKKAVTDSEFVERLRRRIVQYDRNRPAMVAFYLVMFAGFIYLCIRASDLLAKANIPQAWQGFTIGIILGAMLGSLAFKLGHGLVNALSKGLRSERLLVRYYDALCDHERERTEKAMPQLTD